MSGLDTCIAGDFVDGLLMHTSSICVLDAPFVTRTAKKLVSVADCPLSACLTFHYASRAAVSRIVFLQQAILA